MLKGREGITWKMKNIEESHPNGGTIVE